MRILKTHFVAPPTASKKKSGTIVIGKSGDVVHTEWVLEMDDTNLAQVMCLNDVNLMRTYSNNGVEILIFNVLGIEATRTAIMRKLRHVIECDDSYVDYRHLALLCAPMTRPSPLMAITRRGINRTDTAALM
ncbi:hypothetical protein EDB83DRAFT_2237112 [Lactarius deliciosus]|nr:hypothetical protein EDB83DRAFT_2237112 [Lactarius deliciosus]